MENVLNFVQSHQWLFLVISFLCLIGMYISWRNIVGMRNATHIIENQFNPVDQSVIEVGFKYYKGDDLKRYTILIRRLRTKLGHNGITVGYFAWVNHVVTNPTIDAESVEMPDFRKE